MKRIIVSLLLPLLFNRLPTITLTKEEKRQCQQLYNDSLKAANQPISYHLKIPKYKFLYYLLTNESILLHGSNNKEITTFEPRPQTLFHGELTTATFATSDPIWPFFYAVFDKSKLKGTMRNGAISATGSIWYHYYSLTPLTFHSNPWTTGMIYLLPKESFQYVEKGTLHFNEWICKQHVSPIAKLEVEPADFYFIREVTKHQQEENLLKTLLLYKFRSCIKK